MDSLEQGPIGKLPPELFWDIANRLDLISLTRLSQVCQSVNHFLRPILDNSARARALPNEEVYNERFTTLSDGKKELNIYDGGSKPPQRLAVAIWRGHHNVVESYLKVGIDANFYCLSGERFLNIAIRNNKAHIMDLLLAYGADPSASDITYSKDPDSNYPFYPVISYSAKPLVNAAHSLALLNGCSMADYMVQRLIMAGVDLTPQGAIHLIVRYCSVATIKMAVAHGANLYQLDGEGSTILHHLYDDTDLSKLTYVLKEASDLLQVTNVMEETALFSTIRAGCEDVALLLWEAYFKSFPSLLSTRASSGDTLLHVAIEYNMESLAIKLIESGIIIDQLGQYGSELHCAIERSMVSVVRLLLSRGVDVNFFTDTIDTPLCLAVELNEREIVEILLNEGRADMTIVRPRGLDAVHMAFHKGFWELGDYLGRRWDEEYGDAMDLSDINMWFH